MTPSVTVGMAFAGRWPWTEVQVAFCRKVGLREKKTPRAGEIASRRDKANTGEVVRNSAGSHGTALFQLKQSVCQSINCFGNSDLRGGRGSLSGDVICHVWT
jgi:hypothetical protein